MQTVPQEVLVGLIEVACCFFALLMTTAGYLMGLR